MYIISYIKTFSIFFLYFLIPCMLSALAALIFLNPNHQTSILFHAAVSQIVFRFIEDVACYTGKSGRQDDGSCAEEG